MDGSKKASAEQRMPVAEEATAPNGSSPKSDFESPWCDAQAATRCHHELSRLCLAAIFQCPIPFRSYQHDLHSALGSVRG